MTYCLLLRFDSGGPRPVVVREDEQLARGDGVRYRFIAQAETLAEVHEIEEDLNRRIEAREL